LYAEFKILVRVKALGITWKGCSGQFLLCPLLLRSYLLYLQDNKFCWFQRRKSYNNINNTSINIILSCCGFITLYKICLFRIAPLESSLAEQILHEVSYIEPNLRP